jgi:uncharacterized coiled-coil DUF342 family protein
MGKIREWVHEHKSLIIGLLVLVLMLKSCTACQQERQYEYKQIMYEKTIDSMQYVIDERSMDTKDLCDTIHSLRAENTILKDVIKDLKGDRDHYRKVNSELVVVTDKLSTKNDTIN